MATQRPGFAWETQDRRSLAPRDPPFRSPRRRAAGPSALRRMIRHSAPARRKHDQSGSLQLAPNRERAADRFARATTRSEEHTSELQSLMRISYAVFCLKKKKSNEQIHIR